MDMRRLIFKIFLSEPSFEVLMLRLKMSSISHFVSNLN
jgi:hypothetical protein